MTRFSRVLSLMFLLTGIVSLCLPAEAAQQQINSGTRLLCLNVGKADCMLLWADDRVYLIDTGYEHTYPVLETAFDAFGITHLDGVFLTHVHQDHDGGLEKLSESNISVGAWYAAAIYYDSKPTKHAMYKAASNRGQNVTWLESGDVIQISDSASFQVLGPVRTNTDNENNNSLVMRFSSPDGSILFCGDMKEEEEADLLADGLLAPCDILKVGHHGDNKATTKALLDAVRPKTAVISTSSIEETDTPARATLSRLNAAGADIYVTQDAQDGLIFILNEGNITAQDFSWAHIPPRAEGLIASIQVRNDVYIIKNTSSKPITLTGAYLYSSKGNDVFSLPDISLGSGEQYVIGSEKSTVPCDYVAQKKRLWHDEDRDVGILYDAYGRILCGTDNGILE